jgi:hypothetical protein
VVARKRATCFLSLDWLESEMSAGLKCAKQRTHTPPHHPQAARGIPLLGTRNKLGPGDVLRIPAGLLLAFFAILLFRKGLKRSPRMPYR